MTTAAINENNPCTGATPSVMQNFYQNPNIYCNYPMNNYQNSHYYNLTYPTQYLQPTAVAAAAMQQYGGFLNSSSAMFSQFDTINDKSINGIIDEQHRLNITDTSNEKYSLQSNNDSRRVVGSTLPQPSELVFPSTSSASSTSINASIQKFSDNSNFFNSTSTLSSNNSTKLVNNKTRSNHSSFLLSNINRIKGKKTKDKTTKNLNL